MTDWVHAVERAYVASATGGAAPAPAPFSRDQRPSAAESAARPRRASRGGPRDPLGEFPEGFSPRALAAAGAVASHYLAVGTPRSLALIGGDEAPHSLVAHRTWFNPTDIRCTSPTVASIVHGRVVPIAEALTADIVCIHVPLALAASQLRRGTHVNALAPVNIDGELRQLATIVDEPKGLPALAAGLVDGRQLDEITIFVAGDAAIAAAALAGLGPAVAT